MVLTEQTAVPLAALPMAEFKAHLRLGTGFSDDDIQDPVLESFLRAAMSAIEARTGKILIERSFSWIINAWRDSAGQAFPVAPVTDILSFFLNNVGGDPIVIDFSLYRLEQDSQRPVLRPTGAALPTIPTGGTAQLFFAAGFADSWDDLPADLAQAMLLLAAHYYEYRHETVLGEGCMPYGVSSLIERYRTVRLFGGGRD